MAKRTKRVSWTNEHVRDLKAHSKSKTPVVKISKAMKRTPGAIRQKALSLGIAIGHRRKLVCAKPTIARSAPQAIIFEVRVQIV